MVIFCSELANSNTVAVLVGALMAGWFGFKQYRSQKIWEKIDERYFKDGIEEFISDLQRIRRTLEHNFYYSLLVLKYYRDLDNKDFLEQFDLKRIKNNNKLSSKIPSSLWITNLFLKNEHFNKVCVNLFASVGAINDYYISDCMVGLDMMIEDPKRIKFTKEETVKKIFKENNQKYKEVHKELGLYVLIDTLEEILFVLRKLNIDSYKKLEKAHKNKEVKELLKKLESIKLSEKINQIKTSK